MQTVTNQELKGIEGGITELIVGCLIVYAIYHWATR